MAEPVGRAILAFIGLVIACGALIAATAALTRERIEENRARRFLQTLTELSGSPRLAADLQWQGDVALICPERAVLRGVARGYGGDIRWLAAADLSGHPPVLSDVRVTAHQETPGIADFLDEPGQGWLARLHGLDAATVAGLDGVSGATITSRALTRDLAAALQQPALAQPGCDP